MKKLILSMVLALGCGLIAADAPVQPPEIAAEHDAAIAAGDAYANKAAVTIDGLKAQIAQLQESLALANERLATAEADKQAAVSKALNDYKASLGAVPFPPSLL